MAKKTKDGSLTLLIKREKKVGFAFASPWLIGLAVFTAFPMLASFFLSFTRYDMVSSPRFIGLTNYRILFFSDNLFWTSLWNTLYHVMLAVPLGLIVGILLALLLNSRIRGIGVYRTIFYLPNVVSIVAMGLLWLWLFQPHFGLINQVLDPVYSLFNMDPIGWYRDASWSKFTIVLMGLWTAGGSMIIYLAQMQDIPKEYYEAAEIDGAGSLRRIYHITLPLMTPSIFFNFIMGIIAGFQVFAIAHIMTGGGPARSTYYFGYYLFDKMIMDHQMGSASAMAWVLLFVTLIITILALRLNRYVFYLGEQD